MGSIALARAADCRAGRRMAYVFPDSIALAYAADCCSIVLDVEPFFLVRCGVQDCGVQDGGDLSRMMHDARTSLPIRPARRQYSKCSPFY